ncbi:MAG: FKBP-type peptidyl-prolyl cis-trans isomerase [Deltaproteobacteria bacterium]|nr:FKBP-type peptidyl-prolyl cis-trans isomerase [Deltaproteobacteria bacterium]
MAWIRVGVIGLVFVLIPACTPQAEVKLETEDQKTIYALGLGLARNLAVFEFSEEELEFVVEGIRDGALKRPPKVDAKQYRAKIQTLQRSRLQAQAEGEKSASQAFLEKEAGMEGAERSTSGLVYRELEAGSGESPTKNNTVRVHYHGTLRDGTVFDSSVDRGTPFVTKLTRVIPCWTEGLQKMRVGGKARLVCPSQIAYRDRGSPPHIKPGATIAFDVELIEIVK